MKTRELIGHLFNFTRDCQVPNRYVGRVFGENVISVEMFPDGAYSHWAIGPQLGLSQLTRRLNV